MSRFSFYSSFFLLLRLVAAQTSGSEEGSGFNPTMALIMIVLVSFFFALGCISVYLRRCIEQLLGMDDGRTGDPGNWLNVSQTACGLDASVIETFPTFCYSTVKTLRIGKEALECSVCLNEFEDDETLCLIPICCHVFHPGCINTWLRSHATCPLCRANLVPVPGESAVSIQIPGLIDDPPGSDSAGDHRVMVLGSPDARLINSIALTCNQSMPRRSMSTGCNLARSLTKPDGTGQHAENLNRFTLRLPQDIHNKLVNPSLTKCHVDLPHMMSSARGYRTGSLETNKNYFYYKRSDQGRLERKPFSITPPTGSITTSQVGDSDRVRAGTPNELLLAMRTPFDQLGLEKNEL